MRLGLRRRTVPTRTLVWCVGVRAGPFVEDLDLPTQNGRLVVDEYLAVPGHPEVIACGDAAAVAEGRRAREGPTEGVPPRRSRLPRRPGRRQGRREPIRRTAVRDRGQGRDQGLSPHLDAGQPHPNLARLGGRRRPAPPGRAAGPRPRPPLDTSSPELPRHPSAQAGA